MLEKMYKTMLEKEKMLVTCNFALSHNPLKSFFLNVIKTLSYVVTGEPYSTQSRI